jgi:hypothetical protein
MKKNSPIAVPSWQAEDDMRTLARAEEIRRDPKRLAAAKAEAKKKLEEIATVAATKPTE